MGSKDKVGRNFWGSEIFANFLSLIALVTSIFVLYRTEFGRGQIVVSFPSRVAIASAEDIQVQGNDSDKILLSFAIHNTGTNLKTVRKVTLTITSQEEEVEFVADAQFDQLKNIQLSEFQLIDNENYSLISAFSIPSHTHVVANYLFFY